MSSPIDFLVRDFFASLAGIAPERAAELREEMRKHGINFVVKDIADRCFFYADPVRGTVSVGTGSLERLWASAYGYFGVYDAVAAAKWNDLDVREVNLKADPRTRKAAELLEWALSAEIALAAAEKSGDLLPDVTWPSDLPRPVENPAHASDEHVASELFLCAGAFILHHEVAHIRLEHDASANPEKKKQLEAEADEAAAKWILEGLGPADPRFMKRCLGIALALASLTGLAAFVEEDTKSHPTSSERLFRTLGAHVADPNHTIWAVVGTILRANVAARGVAFDESREASSFKDDAEYCAEVLTGSPPLADELVSDL